MTQASTNRTSRVSQHSNLEDNNGYFSRYVWGLVVDPIKLSKNNIGAYIIEKANDYRVSELFGKDAWVRFKEDFKGFTAKSFKKPGSRPVQQLRNALLERDMYIVKDS